MGSNQQSSKGNPASKRMMNPSKKAKRAKNKAKNEYLKERGIHPKQLRAKEEKETQELNRKVDFILSQMGWSWAGFTKKARMKKRSEVREAVQTGAFDEFLDHVDKVWSV